jgi:hypothetical protein
MLPLGFFQFTLAAAMGAALTALEEVPEQRFLRTLREIFGLLGYDL